MYFVQKIAQSLCLKIVSEQSNYCEAFLLQTPQFTKCILPVLYQVPKDISAKKHHILGP